jgi:hypothetical protein
MGSGSLFAATVAARQPDGHVALLVAASDSEPHGVANGVIVQACQPACGTDPVRAQPPRA